MRGRLFVIVAIMLHSPALFAEEQNPEMDYMLEKIGESKCVFIRYSSRHSAEKVEDHLRMKYERDSHYATSAEAFIERRASKLYMRECPGEDAKPSGEWLTQRFEEFRRGQA